MYYTVLYCKGLVRILWGKKALTIYPVWPVCEREREHVRACVYVSLYIWYYWYWYWYWYWIWSEVWYRSYGMAGIG